MSDAANPARRRATGWSVAILLLAIVLAILAAPRTGCRPTHEPEETAASRSPPPAMPGPGRTDSPPSPARSAPPETPPPPAGPSEDRAEIVVRGPDGAPLAGATVRLLVPPPPPIQMGHLDEVVSAVTDNQGRVRFPVAARQGYQLKVEHPDLCAAGDVVCHGGRVTEFTLPEGGTLSGVVRDEETGAPIAGATVVVIDAAASSILHRWRTTTDDRGRYRVTGLGPGLLNPRAWSDEHAFGSPEEAPRIEPGRETRCDLTLTRGVRLTLRVYDQATDLALPDVEILGHVHRHARGHGDGLRTLPVAGGIELLVIRAPGYLDEMLLLEPDAITRPQDAIEVPMTRGAIVRGTLRTAAGGPVAGRRVHLCSAREKREGRSWRTAVTDRAGRFEVRAAHPGGDVRVVVEFEGGTRRWGAWIAVPDDGTPVEVPPLVVAPTTTVSGRILAPDGTPIRRAGVTAHAAPPASGALGSTETGPDGRFGLSGLPPSRVLLVLYQGPDHATRLREVDARADVKFTWRLEAGRSISGRALHEDGRPIERRGVLVRGPGRIDVCRIDGDGFFRIEGLPVGRYRLEVAGYPESAVTDVAAGATDVSLVVPD